MDVGALVGYGTSEVVARSESHGVVPSVVGMGVGYGASELVGYLIGRHHEKLQRTNVPVPLVVGAALQVGSVIAHAMGVGRASVAGAVGLASVRAVGDAAANGFFVLDGVARGYAASGKSLFEADKQAAIKGASPVHRLWGQPATSVGAIPQVSPGDWLDGPGLRHFAQGR